MGGRLRALPGGVNTVAERVGWVEHSETHHVWRGGWWVSLRSTHPTNLLRICLGAEFGHEGVAHGIEIEAVRLDQGHRLGDDLVDVADQLEALVKVRAVKAEALAQDLHEVDDF